MSRPLPPRDERGRFTRRHEVIEPHYPMHEHGAPFAPTLFTGGPLDLTYHEPANLPAVIDLSGPVPAIAPANEDLFDDEDLQQYHPPPKPPSENFYRLDERLQALHTQMVYLGVPGSAYSGKELTDRAHWDLWGPAAGRQGLMLAPQFSGLMHLPFQHIVSEGPYTIGAVPERVDWKKRELGFGVMVGVGWGPDTSFRYRMLEERWWRSWSAREDGWWGVYTRTHGWRCLRVRLAEDPKNAFVLDPVNNEDGFMQWDLSIEIGRASCRERVCQYG